MSFLLAADGLRVGEHENEHLHVESNCLLHPSSLLWALMVYCNNKIQSLYPGDGSISIPDHFGTLGRVQ